MNTAWKDAAARRYDRCNRETLEWMLGRPGQRGFLDTKVNALSGQDYTESSGVRGPTYTYGWIQGRGLEALVTFAEHYRGSDPALAGRLSDRAHALYTALADLFARDGHAYFLYDADLAPVRHAGDGVEAQAPTSTVYTYSDAFVAKGLIAASGHVGDGRQARYVRYLHDVIAAIEDRRFQMNETGPLQPDQARAQPDDFGPRMILLGAAGLLYRCGLSGETGFADRFIDHVLGLHHDDASGLLLNVPGEDVCNIGHGIELCGFAFEHLAGRPGDPRTARLAQVLRHSLEAGLQGPGVALTLSAQTGEALSPHYPWWPMPEAIRATALGFRLTGDVHLLDLWQRADAAFFERYWQPYRGYAYQTQTVDGPVDFVPATPDLDPGYHTGLSLLAAIKSL